MITQEKTLGERIGEELESRKWTQVYLASQIGCHKSYVSKLVNDKLSPNIKHRRKLKQIFGWT